MLSQTFSLSGHSTTVNTEGRGVGYAFTGAKGGGVAAEFVRKKCWKLLG